MINTTYTTAFAPALILRAFAVIILTSVSHISGAAVTDSDEYQLIQWTDLIPKEDLDALMNPPEELLEIADGSEADQLAGQLQSPVIPTTDKRYQQALISTQVRPEFHKTKVRIPGFIVPLDFDEEQTITSFFIVPYFGACIHTPPPPPNQIIYASFEKGLKIGSLMDPFWIEGTLVTKIESNDLGTSAYSMTVNNTLPYSE